MCFCCCDCCCCDCLLIIIAVFFPPLPVCIKKGLCSCDFLINICLCLLGWIPGMLHAWYIILNNPDQNKVLVDDEERQIFIVTPPQTTHVIINKQPNQTKIKFSHPEPFLESSRHNSNNDPNNNSLINSNNLSPLSNTPLLKPSKRNDYVSSPLSKAENNYNAINELNIEGTSNSFNNNNNNDDDADDNNQQPPPPSYEIVMSETAKQFN